MKQANVYVGNSLAGVLTEDNLDYEFRYDSEYLKSEEAEAVSTRGHTGEPQRFTIVELWGGSCSNCRLSNSPAAFCA